MKVLRMHSGHKKPRLLKALYWILSIIIFLVIAVYIAFQVSPWPSVLLIRHAFHKQGRITNEQLARYVPPGITAILDLSYASSGHTKLDLYYPEKAGRANTTYPLIVWVHGGGFVAGDKSELANYCKILASKGFAVAAVNYSLAPGAIYPVPVGQVNEAIAYLARKATELSIDSSCMIIAGDSGGAHIAAQLANCFTNSAYAGLLGITPSVDPGKLKGALLYCGPYNAKLVNLEDDYAWFLKTVLWSYMGNKDFKNDPKVNYFSVSEFVSGNFPRTFISVGNKDPLSPHSHDLAAKLTAKGVLVDSLFFPDDYSPGLPHEYQFNLDNNAGKLALDRTLQFLSWYVREPR